MGGGGGGACQDKPTQELKNVNMLSNLVGRQSFPCRYVVFFPDFVL